MYIRGYILFRRRGRGAMARAPDCLASHTCVPVPNPAVNMWGFFILLAASLDTATTSGIASLAEEDGIFRQVALFLPSQCD